ncbi:MAG TPA: type IV secretory system conjugative DNA transfer family protein [Conexibacter sp.]|nr:type IV secretory system conjugative DNA transfer family protein [Conexibacter sp.]
MSKRSTDEKVGIAIACIVGGLAVYAAIATVVVEWATLVWTTVRLRPALLPAGEVSHVAIHALLWHEAKPPRSWDGIAPPLWIGVILTLLLGAAILFAFASVWMRFEIWSGRGRIGLHESDPRRKVKARAFAKPRDWSHLQPPASEARNSAFARVASGAVRPLAGEKRRPAPRGGDGWNMGLLRGREVRSAGEQHLLGVAPSRSGKSLRIVGTEAHEHGGPLVVTSNKLDVLRHTIGARRQRGPVWVYAPMSPLPHSIACAGWSPLRACRDWPGALRMGQWLHDADPSASAASKGDGAAHFYDRNAVERALPPVLHAAALAGRAMSDVYDWLLVGADALDEPREILHAHDADRAVVALRALQAMDPKAQGFVLMSAAQLLGAYRHPQVQAADRDEFDPAELLTRNGTLYLIAPESDQAALAPIFGGMLGAILREREERAAAVADPRRLPLLKLVCDEAAHLAALGRLPAYLAVSAGWNVRWAVIFQSYAQLRSRYGVDADTIIANTLCKLHLGPIHDKTTREELVAFLGNEYVEVESETTDRWGGGSTRTKHEQARPKLAPEQLAQLGDGEAIAIHGRDLPAIVKLPFWWEWLGCSSANEGIALTRRGAAR